MAERHARRTFLGRAGSLRAGLRARRGCGIEGTLERAEQAATPIPEITHPKVADRQLDVLELAALHRQEGLKNFDKQYGGHVKYVEDINDNDEFYGKVRQQLQADQPIGRDIVTLTDYMARKWVRNGYVEPLDKKNMPNVVKNLVDNLKYDPVRPEPRLHPAVAVGRRRASATTRRRPAAS